MINFVTNENDNNRTLFKVITSRIKNVPRSKVESLFRKKDIKVDGKRINNKKFIVLPGMEITIYGVEKHDKSVTTVKHVPVSFDVLYEDENILVVNKPKGVSMSEHEKSLDNQVLSYLKIKKITNFQPSSAGRLDKVTSGIVIYGKNADIVRELKANVNKFKKIYYFKSDLNKDITTTFRISHNEDLKREVCGDEGKETKTIFKITNREKTAELVTGRKHQIRASLSKLGFPIYGDVRYGGKKAERVYLHHGYSKINGLSDKFENIEGMEFWSKPNW